MTQPCRLHRLVWLGLLLAARAGAADGSAITGAVTDLEGKPLVGATVVVAGPAIEGPRTVLSEAGGVYTVEGLPPGTYSLTVTMPGRAPYRRSDLAVKENTTLRAGVRLAPEGTDANEIVVTGSRVRRKDLGTSAPVTIIDRKQIEASGVVGLGEFLQRLPIQGNSLNTQVAYGNDGEVRIDLRSLESKRTLVLVNGRRMVGGGSGGQSQVDLATIPLAAVERIEILKDGASPIYGTDAVAGVVNVILKKKFEGTQLSAMTGVSSRGDAQSLDLSFSTGITGERGSSFFSIGYQQQRQLLGGARGFSRYPIFYDFDTGTRGRWGSSTTPDGTIQIPNVESVCADPTSITNPALQGACQAWKDGGQTNNAFVYDRQSGTYRLAAAGDAYNFQTDSSLLTPARRLQLFATGNYELHPAVRAFYEASFVNLQSSKLAPPAPLDISVSGQSLYNPFGVDMLVSQRATLGPRHIKFENDAFRIVGGLEGDLGSWAGPLDGWGWDLSYLFGRNVAHDSEDGLLRLSALGAETGPSFLDGGVPTCGTPGAPISGCTPLDVLHGAPTLTPGQRSTLEFTKESQGSNELHVFSLSANGKLFTLGADRPAGLAIGFEYRRESGGYLPDPLTQLGDSPEGQSGAIRGGYSTREAYAELSLPLLSGKPWVDDLELSAAARTARYTSFGSNTTFKLGGRWRPVRDVTLRGTFSTAFRAPSVAELYEPNADGQEGAGDPCTNPSDPAILAQCQAEPGPLPGTYGSGQVQTLTGGNPRLRPETARILTAGVVVEPRWVKDLALTIDFWSIDLDSAVSFVGAQNILDHCYTGQSSGWCDRVHRDPATGQISYVDDRLGNIGGTVTSGVDLSGQWLAPAGPLGKLQLTWDATYLLRFDQTYADGSKDKGAGTYTMAFPLPRWRWLAGVGWQRGSVEVSTAARYVGSYDECYLGSCTYFPDNRRTVPANLVFDLAGSWKVKSGVGTTALQVGVRNVFDRAPPFINAARDNNTDPNYDYVGRYYWARVTQAF